MDKGEFTEVQLLKFAKIMDEKQTFTYKKLVVPMSMRSIYWKFFGFPASDDGEILTKVKIVCIICKTQIAYNRNTSNLRMHLQNKHSKELLELETLNPPKKLSAQNAIKQKLRDQRIQRKMLKSQLAATEQVYSVDTIDSDSIQFVTEASILAEGEASGTTPLRVIIKDIKDDTRKNVNHELATIISDAVAPAQAIAVEPEDNKVLFDAIAEFVIIDLQLPDIVEGRGFQRLLATLKSPCEIPSRSKLEEDIIPQMYNTTRESVTSIVQAVNSDVTLTFEEWQSNYLESFVTITAYYQNATESGFESKLLGTIHAPLDLDVSQWGGVIDNTLDEWNLKVDKVTTAVVGSSREELSIALTARGITVIPCLLHILQVCAQACFDSDQVKAILTKARAIIGAINSRHLSASALGFQEHLSEELDQNALTIDYPTLWISTYTMMEQLVSRRKIIPTIIQNIEGIEHETLELSRQQWKIMEELVSVLEPFKVTIITLSEEKIPLISLLKPLLWQLVSSHIKIKDSDSDIARTIKQSLSEMLCEKYADSNINTLLLIATALDPRFKQLPYESDEVKSQIAGPIKEKLVKLIKETPQDQQRKQSSSLEDEPLEKKRRISGMQMLLGGLCAAKTGVPTQEKADVEMVQYQAEPAAALDCCPLQWWTKIAFKCPNLGKLARKHISVPACCVPPSRIPEEAQITFNARRAAIPVHLVDKLLFLHANHSF